MTSTARRKNGRGWFAALVGLAAGVVACPAPAEAPAALVQPLPAETPPEPRAAKATEPPLAPVLRLIEQSRQRLERDVRDYTCRIVRRERIGGKVRPFEFALAKIRRPQPGGAPFSVYLRFVSPASVAGREVLYVEGRNAGKMLVRRGGQRRAYLTTFLDPESPLAMEGSRHPVTNAGFDHLLTALTSDLREDMDEPGVEVTFYHDSKINNRPCTRIAIVHPEEKAHLTSHRTEIFLDKERRLPVSVARYLWPKEAGGRPRLVEQYVYDRLKLNVGLTDADFNRDNPDYGFLKRQKPPGPKS